MEKRLQVRLFGSIEIAYNNTSLTFASEKVCLLLVYLLLNADKQIEHSYLSLLFWEEMLAAQGRKNLRQSIYQLRQSLAPLQVECDEDVLIVSRTKIGLRLDGITLDVDVARYDSLIRQARQCANHLPVQRVGCNRLLARSGAVATE